MPDSLIGKAGDEDWLLLSSYPYHTALDSVELWETNPYIISMVTVRFGRTLRYRFPPLVFAFPMRFYYE